MNQKVNRYLLDEAWKLAYNQCDVTCPPEVVREKAQEIFEDLLVEAEE